MAEPLPSIYDMTFEELQIVLKSWEEPAYRTRQLWTGLYQSLWDKPEQFSSLPQVLRKKLADNLTFTMLTPVKEISSSDRRTSKTLFKMVDGYTVETVLMRYDERQTLCISTQSGCPMGCVFCATGQMGFGRDLTSGEILSQVLYFARTLRFENLDITNVVIMGMGEPFYNYDATLKAVDILNDAQGFNLGARRFTISTVGLVPAIQRFTKEHRQVNLAISLHAANDKLRSKLLPVNKRYPLTKLLETCWKYTDETHRRITFEWALIQDINDSVQDARELASLIRGRLCHVNIIPLNPTRKYSGQATTLQKAAAFKAVLDEQKIPCTIRLRRGIDIHAGCGQLASDN
jgi:23S rRNA (adenine2503-C2)-methyltransferase